MHRKIRIDKLKNRLYHIADLNIIVKILYPYRQTINKYSRLLKQMTFTDPQQELLDTTIHSLTIVNELYRDKDKYGRLYTTREDIGNAIVMLQNELDLKKADMLLTPNLRWFYNQLQLYFIDKEFTSKQVGIQLRKSKSTCYHNLRELTDRELLTITGKTGTSFLYKLNENKVL